MKHISSLLAAVALLLLCGGCGQVIIKTKAKQGDAEAQFELGAMYYDGRGVPQDYKEAAKWIRKAAEQGDATAQNQLGWMYCHGQGVPKSEVEAYAWVLLAKANGEEDQIKISILENHLLTLEQIEQGQARAAELQRLIEERKENPKPSVESP